MKLISIAISCGLVIHAYLLRRHAGTWLTPASIWCLMWFLLTFIPLVAAPEAPANPLAILYILATSIILSIPVFTTDWAEVRRSAKFDPPALYETRFLRVVFVVISVAALLSLAVNFSIQGVTLDRLTSDFLSVTSDLIVDRYTQSTIENVFAQLANIFTYCSAGLGGLVFFGARRALAKLAIVGTTMAPSLALMVIAGAKGTIFLCIALFYGAFLAARLRRGGVNIIDRKTILATAVSVAAIFPFLLLSFLARGLSGPMSASALEDGLYRNFISYSSAHIYAFADWFTWYTGGQSAVNFAGEETTGGFYTFMSIFRAFGSEKIVPPGYYDEYFQYSWYLQTNIYTIYRGLITDFTLVGSMVFMVLFGYLVNTVFVSLTRSDDPSWSIALYILYVGLVYTSFLISVFVWNSMYPVFIILGIIFKLNNSRVRKAKRGLPA